MNVEVLVRYKKHILLLSSMLLLMLLGINIRREIVDIQYTLIDPDLPFTRESALQYRMTSTVFEKGVLPLHDKSVQYPQGINPYKTYSIGAEYLYALAAHCMPAPMKLPDRFRWAALILFCVGIPGIILWTRRIFGSWIAGYVAGAFYAFSLSTVIRSTGQELSRENLGLPLLIWFLALDASAERCKSFRYTIPAAVFLALSVMAWDMIQYFLILYMISIYIALIRNRIGKNFLVYFLSLMLAGILNPYLREHYFLLSLPMLLSYGIILCHGAGRFFPNLKGSRYLLPALPLMLGLFLNVNFTENYSHFFELIKAKILFLNVKPSDPSLLNFTQRIMWTPALHSSTWESTKSLFPASLILTSLALLCMFFSKSRRTDIQILTLIFYTLISGITYVFFARFHVYLGLFISALIGGWAHQSWNCKGWKKGVGIILIAAGLFIEIIHVLNNPIRWGRANVYFKYDKELIEWLREHAQHEPVLANFGISGNILAYAECPILLHPKFENPAIRNRVKEYGEQLFKGTEESFRNWAEKRGAEYYVFALGEFAKKSVDLQMRYMVDALEPLAGSPARLFNDRPLQTTHFKLKWRNRKYCVFRIIHKKNESFAREYAELAKLAFQHGELKDARKWLDKSFGLNPNDKLALEIWQHVESLKSKNIGK